MLRLRGGLRAEGTVAERKLITSLLFASPIKLLGKHYFFVISSTGSNKEDLHPKGKKQCIN
jgi:hypothetical protein